MTNLTSTALEFEENNGKFQRVGGVAGRTVTYSRTSYDKRELSMWHLSYGTACMSLLSELALYVHSASLPLKPGP